MDMTLIIDSNLHHLVFRTHQVCVASANEHSAASIQYVWQMHLSILQRSIKYV